MGILDDVVINVKSAAEYVGNKAGQIVDVSKLRINISELNGEINKRYGELGRMVYDSQKKGETFNVDITQNVAEIDDLYAQLNAVVNEMNTLQNKVLCPVCGKQCSAESAYCSYCGSKLKVEATAQEEDTEDKTAE